VTTEKAVFLAQFVDEYELKARLRPGLLAFLPVLVPLVAGYGQKNPILTGIVALFSTCGVMHLLGSIARDRGKVLEQKLIKEWGGLPTTLLLRHRDTFLDSHSKARYHAAIEQKLKTHLPTAAEEAADPAGADQKYIGVTRELRELTRGNKLLFKENIAYGFKRNMCGLKPVGLVLSFIGLFLGLLMAQVVGLQPLDFDVAKLLAPGLAGGISIAVPVAMIIAWLFFATKSDIRKIGDVYAERLFEAIKDVKKKPATPAGSAKKSEPIEKSQ